MAALVDGVRAKSAAVAFRLSWTGTPGGSPLTKYKLQVKSGSTFKNVALPGPLSTSVQVSPAPGTTKTYRIQAIDSSGRASPWESITLQPQLVNDGSAGVVYSGSWAKKSVSGSVGGTVRTAKSNGAQAVLTTSARSIAVVLGTGPKFGKVSVTIDGGAPTVIDLHSASAHPAQVLLAVSWSSVGPHVITISAITSQRPRVDLDALLVIG
jgi:hypothetical protein